MRHKKDVQPTGEDFTLSEEEHQRVVAQLNKANKILDRYDQVVKHAWVRKNQAEKLLLEHERSVMLRKKREEHQRAEHHRSRSKKSGAPSTSLASQIKDLPPEEKAKLRATLMELL